MRLFELCGKDRACGFSPYVWRTKMALAHKGLAYETVLTQFLEKDGFAAADATKVPVLDDNGTWVRESWDIACYLEDAHAHLPPLFGGDSGRAHARFIDGWANMTIIGGLFPLLALAITPLLDDANAEYFRKTREGFLGTTLEAFAADPERHLARFRKSLEPLRLTLRDQPFLGGDLPSYADYSCFGPFQWARLVLATDVLAPDDPLQGWRLRLLSLHDGVAGKAKTAV